MIRLHIIVEGQAEETFVREVLCPDLSPRNIFPDARRVETKKEGPRRFKGGGRHYLKWRQDILRWTKQESGADVWFTTMVDLYCLPGDFPGHDECRKIPDPHRRVTCLEKQFGEDIAHPRFVPYIQLHEYEALLFADVDKFATAYPGEHKRIAQLSAIREQFKTVDEIDEGQHSAPSKRIRQVFPEYDKVIGGALIAMDIGLERMCAESPHFQEWLARLHSLT